MPYSAPSGETIYGGLPLPPAQLLGYPARLGQQLVWPGVASPFVITGPGDPEGLLYLTEAQQDAILASMVANGGNVLYVQVVRYVALDGGGKAGDGGPNEQPFLNNDPATNPGTFKPDFETRTDSFLAKCEVLQICVLFHLYDDFDAPNGPFPNGDTVPPDELTFINALVSLFGARKCCLWMTGEEVGEAFTPARVIAQATAIKNANFNLSVGVHQQNGRVFQHAAPGVVDWFSMQLNELDEAQLYNDTKFAYDAALLGGYGVLVTERGDPPARKGAAARREAWICFIAGAAGEARFEMDPLIDLSDLQDCRRMSNILNSIDWQAYLPDDTRLSSSGHLRVNSLIEGYAVWSADTGTQVLLDLISAGIYNITWNSLDVDQTVLESSVILGAGVQNLSRPVQISTECFVHITKV